MDAATAANSGFALTSSLSNLATPADASNIAYLHRYSNVTLAVPALGLGGFGTGTATVTGLAANDQCFVAPTSATSALSYVMGPGWSTTAGALKVQIVASSLAALSATTINVNLLCAQ